MFSSSLHGNLCQDYHGYFSESHSAGGNITAMNLDHGQLHFTVSRRELAVVEKKTAHC